MSLSDQLMQLSIKTKELEDRSADAMTRARADLEMDVRSARDAAQAHGDSLRNSAETSEGNLSSWWQDVQRSWDDHLTAVRESIGDKRATHDLKRAEKAAQRADDDAAFAVDFAFAAIEEAEYALLDAALAHVEADELANA